MLLSGAWHVTALLLAGTLRELPARVRPVSRLVRQPARPALSATRCLRSAHISVRSSSLCVSFGPQQRLSSVLRGPCVCVTVVRVWTDDRRGGREENTARVLWMYTNTESVYSADITLNVFCVFLGPPCNVAVFSVSFYQAINLSLFFLHKLTIMTVTQFLLYGTRNCNWFVLIFPMSIHTYVLGSWFNLSSENRAGFKFHNLQRWAVMEQYCN
jgi:hypothetical protein